MILHVQTTTKDTGIAMRKYGKYESGKTDCMRIVGSKETPATLTAMRIKDHS